MSVRPGEQQADEPGPGSGAADSAGAEVVRLPVASGVPAGETQGEKTVTQGETTIGQRLREAREAAGLSLEDIAARTKIRQGMLASIEADDHDRLPALTYALGFIKAYARTVGLNPDEAAAQFRREAGRDDPPVSPIELKPLEERRIPGRGLVIASVAAVVVAVGLLAALAMRGVAPAAAPEAAAEAAAATLSATPQAASSAAVPPPAEVAAATTDGSAPVALRAQEDVWVRITDRASGERFFEGTLAKDQRLEIPADRALLLRAGRAGALQVFIGDELLPPLGGPAEVLRAQPLDRDSLRAAALPRAGLAEAPPPTAG